MAPAARGTPKPSVTIRDAHPDDLPRVQEIYAHHVRHGLASFEEAPPDLAEMTRRFEATRARGLPYLAAEAAPAQEGQALELLGYAYAGPYRPRPAYRFSVENSVYVAPGLEGRGVGRALLEELIARCTALGLRQMVAVVGDSGHLPSIAFHESLGFTRIGTLRGVGFKFGRWVDIVILQRALGGGGETPPEQGK
jgi:phosphinothricin acetyltransferase